MYRYITKALALAAALFAAGAASAQAQGAATTTIPVTGDPIVRVQMRSGTLTIRTWDRAQVQIVSTAPVHAREFAPQAVDRALHGGDIPVFSTSIQTPGGKLTLPPEEFSVASIAESPHQGVVVFGGDQDASITLTVPNSTALIFAAVIRGSIDIDGYRNGAFVARVHNGSIRLTNVSGDGYAEVAHGPIAVRASAMNRIRARTAAGTIFFENCNARQIEVTSIRGSIAYDNGTFVPGLARFQTQSGNVAIGVAGGGVQIGARSSNGHVFSNFSHPADVRSNNAGTQAVVGGGGPVVTASSETGNVYLYDGAFNARPALKRSWDPMGRILKAKTCAKPRCRV